MEDGELSNRSPKIMEWLSDKWFMHFHKGQVPQVSQSHLRARPYLDPPTLVAKLRQEGGELWTGPMPTLETGIQWFLDKAFVIQVGCCAAPPHASFRDAIGARQAGCFGHKREWGRGLIIPGTCYYKMEISHPTKCEQDFTELKSDVLTSLVAGENVYVHCITGITRGPLGAAILRAMATNTTLEQSVQMVQRLRRCDVEQRFRERSRLQDKWMKRALEERVPIYPSFDAYGACGRTTHRKRVVHVIVFAGEQSEEREPEVDAYPLCQWMLGEDAMPLKRGYLTCKEPEEVPQKLGTRFCGECMKKMPARDRLDILEGTDLW